MCRSVSSTTLARENDSGNGPAPTEDKMEEPVARLLFGITLEPEQLVLFREDFGIEFQDATMNLSPQEFSAIMYSWLKNGYVIIRYYPLERIDPNGRLFLILKSYEVRTRNITMVAAPDKNEVLRFISFVESRLGAKVSVREYLMLSD